MSLVGEIVRPSLPPPGRLCVVGRRRRACIDTRDDDLEMEVFGADGEGFGLDAIADVCRKPSSSNSFAFRCGAPLPQT